jgi:hypothetical protein
MAMSKKDYQAIAGAIYSSAHMDRLVFGSEGIGAILSTARRIADVLAADNPRFNRDLFIEACETGKCRGMRQA